MVCPAPLANHGFRDDGRRRSEEVMRTKGNPGSCDMLQDDDDSRTATLRVPGDDTIGANFQRRFVSNINIWCNY